MVAGILPEVADDLGTSIGRAGLLVTAYALGMIVGGPVVTASTAQVPQRRLVLTLLAVAAVGNGASALAPTLWTVLAARFLAGLVTSTFFAHAIVLAVRWSGPDRAGSAVARLALGMSLAMVLGAPLGTVVGSSIGWRATFAALSVAVSVGLLMTGSLSWGKPQPRRTTAVGELRVVAQPAVLAALAVTAVGSTGVLMVFTYLVPLSVGVAGLPSAALPLLMLGYGAASALGNVVGGVMHDRNPRTAVPAVLLTLSMLLVGAWLVAEALVPVVGVVVLVGAGGAALVPCTQARVLSAATDAPTLAVAINASGYQVAAAIAGWVGGLVSDSPAGPRTLYLLAAAVSLVGAAVSRVPVTSARQATRR